MRNSLNLRQALNHFTRKIGIHPFLKNVEYCLRDFIRRWRAFKHRKEPDVGPATGKFSAFELLQEGKLPGRLVLTQERGGEVRPDSMRVLSKLAQNEWEPWPVFWVMAREARLVGPHLIWIDEQKRACQEALYHPWNRGERYLAEPFRPPILRLEGAWTSAKVIWGMPGNYFHWIFDVLPLLGLLEEFPEEVRILVPPLEKPFERESLEMLGLLHRVRETPETFVQVERFYFSPPPAMTGCTNPYAVAFLRRRFLPFVEEREDLPTHFYVSRKLSARGAYNESEVVEYFKKEGWGVVDLETLSLRSQITLFARAKAVCSIHGAAMTNLLWCSAGCKVLELFASNYLNGVYEMFAEAVSCDYSYRVYTGDRFNRIHIDLRDIEDFVTGARASALEDSRGEG